MVCTALGMGLYLLWDLFGNKGDAETIEEVRNHALDITLQHDCVMSGELLEILDGLYQAKPQNVYWIQCKESLPDYSDDREVLAHIDRVFLGKLDSEALRRISKHSAFIGVAVAASPWAAVDMVLSFWRNLKMISDVAQVYGVRPSFKNRLQLIRRVVRHMVTSGVTELAIHQLAQEFGSQVTLGTISARLAQGFGVGVYSAKIGLAAMHVCRPIEFNKDNTPSLQNIASHLKKEVSKLGS